MKISWKYFWGYLLRLGVFVGIGMGIVFAVRNCSNGIERSEAPDQTAAPLTLSRQYAYANDRMVYVMMENRIIEQWSLDGCHQKRFKLPVTQGQDEEYSKDQLLWVDNEEFIWCAEEEEGEFVYATPVEQKEDGEELVFAETRELFRCSDSELKIQGIDPEYLFLDDNLGTVYADDSHLIYQSNEKGWFAYDRESGQQPLKILEYGNIPKNTNLSSMIAGNQILYHTGSESGKIEEGLYGFRSYDLNRKESREIDDRCFSGAAYVTDPDRNKVYYQIADNQSIWEYDYQTGERRELISEKQFQDCYTENHLLWDDAYYNDSLFVDGERLYFVKNRKKPQIFSYTLAKSALRYEEKLTSAVERSGYLNLDDDSDIMNDYLTIAEGKLLLHWNMSGIYSDEEEETGKQSYFDWIRGFLPEDTEEEEEDTDGAYYICIDLETAESKAVTDRDPEKVYFGMLGLWMKPGTIGPWRLSDAVQRDDDTAREAESGNISIQDQLACISRHSDVWIQRYDDEYDDDEDLMSMYYAITDLDHNGRLEIIATSDTEGSGFYTTTYYYQISADGQNLRPITTDIPDIDIKDGIQTVYVNPQTNAYYYRARDYISAGWGARYCWYGAVILDNGMLTERTFAETVADLDKKKKKEIWHAYSYLGGKEQKMKYQDFDPEKMADQFFEGMTKMPVTISWFQIRGKKDLTEQKILKKATRSYQKFAAE